MYSYSYVSGQWLGRCVQENVEYVFMLVFTAEAIAKILALGFLMHSGAYLRSLWNLLDFFIVTIGCAPLAIHLDLDLLESLVSPSSRSVLSHRHAATAWRLQRPQPQQHLLSCVSQSHMHARAGWRSR